jgi:hypothetical protein
MDVDPIPVAALPLITNVPIPVADTPKTLDPDVFLKVLSFFGLGIMMFLRSCFY